MAMQVGLGRWDLLAGEVGIDRQFASAVGVGFDRKAVSAVVVGHDRYQQAVLAAIAELPDRFALAVAVGNDKDAVVAGDAVLDILSSLVAWGDASLRMLPVLAVRNGLHTQAYLFEVPDGYASVSAGFSYILQQNKRSQCDYA